MMVHSSSIIPTSSSSSLRRQRTVPCCCNNNNKTSSRRLLSQLPLMQLLLLLLLLLTTHHIPTSHAFVTVIVELDPHITSTPPTCTLPFINNFESNLTAWVVNATRSLSFLSDFNVPGGFQLTYQNTVRRFLTTKSPPSCSKCNSASCSISCGIGTCNLCASSRRRLDDGGVDETSSTTATTTDTDIIITTPQKDAAAIIQKDEQDSHQDQLQQQRQVVTADWSMVGTYVSNAIEPLVLYYASLNSGGCLGDSNVLGINVTFVSNLVIDTTMAQVLIDAFAFLAALSSPPPPNTPSACCTMDFTSCISYCGTTQTQCTTCGAVDVGWMPLGPPLPNSCTARWGNCNTKACCPGMQCIGDQYWKGCFYIPTQYSTTPSSPTAPTKPTTVTTSKPPTKSPTRLPTAPPVLRPTARPTSGGFWWWL